MAIEPSWIKIIYRQRRELARMLWEPIALLANKCASVWGDQDRLNAALLEDFSSIPYCIYPYVLGNDMTQISDNASQAGIIPGHYQRSHAERPDMKQVMPAWGFLLSQAYISLTAHRPSLMAR